MPAKPGKSARVRLLPSPCVLHHVFYVNPLLASFFCSLSINPLLSTLPTQSLRFSASRFPSLFPTVSLLIFSRSFPPFRQPLHVPPPPPPPPPPLLLLLRHLLSTELLPVFSKKSSTPLSRSFRFFSLSSTFFFFLIRPCVAVVFKIQTAAPCAFLFFRRISGSHLVYLRRQTGAVSLLPRALCRRNLCPVGALPPFLPTVHPCARERCAQLLTRISGLALQDAVSRVTRTHSVPALSSAHTLINFKSLATRRLRLEFQDPGSSPTKRSNTSSFRFLRARSRNTAENGERYATVGKSRDNSGENSVGF